MKMVAQLEEKAAEAMKMFEQIVGEMRAEQKTNEFYEPEEQVRYNVDQRI